MPPGICLRALQISLLEDAVVLRRPSPYLRSIQQAAFSTSSPRSFRPTQSSTKAADTRPKQVHKSFKMPKRAPREGHKPSLEERAAARAARKRIILSNTNALAVPGLKDITKDNMLDEDIKGRVLGLPGEVVDALRAVGAFKLGQAWSNYRRPACLVREEAWELGRLMAEIETDSSGGRMIRRVITGDRKAGKSTLLLQAMAAAFLRGWVVINIPDCELHLFFINLQPVANMK